MNSHNKRCRQASRRQPDNDYARRQALASAARHRDNGYVASRGACHQRQPPAPRCGHRDDRRELPGVRRRRAQLLVERAPATELDSVHFHQYTAAAPGLPENLHAEPTVRTLSSRINAKSREVSLSPDVLVVVVKEVADDPGSGGGRLDPWQLRQPAPHARIRGIMDQACRAGRRRERGLGSLTATRALPGSCGGGGN
jgi:hypothetical protein